MKTPPPPADCGGSSLALLLREIRDAFWNQMERELGKAGHELNFSQYITLKKLAGGTAGVTDLARAAQLNPGAMTRLLDKLEAMGHVARTADPSDRRALHIDLTASGRTMWQDINHCGQRIRERAMAGMDEADRDQLQRLLRQVRDNLSPSDP